MKGLLALIALAAVALSAPAAAAENPRDSATDSLSIAIKVAPADRAAMRDQLAGPAAERLNALVAGKKVARYRILWNRYVDNARWDALMLVQFPPEGIGAWKDVEAEAAAALPPAALKLAREIRSQPVDLMREARDAPAGAPKVYLFIAYDFLTNADEYISYVDGYTVPQMRGWMREGVLNGYGLYLSRFAVGHEWSSLLMLEYRGEAGLARRDITVDKVRKQLASDPAWKAWSDNKAKIRDTIGYVVADEIAAR